jgi:hypothetical protein
VSRELSGLCVIKKELTQSYTEKHRVTQSENIFV